MNPTITTMEKEPNIQQVLNKVWIDRVAGVLEKSGALPNLTEDLYAHHDFISLGASVPYPDSSRTGPG